VRVGSAPLRSPLEDPPPLRWPLFTHLTASQCFRWICGQPAAPVPWALKMVLQDLGRRINAAVSDLTRSQNLDEKVHCAASNREQRAKILGRLLMA